MNKFFTIAIIFLISIQVQRVQNQYFDDWFHERRYASIEAVNLVRSQGGATNMNDLEVDLTNEQYPYWYIDATYRSDWEYTEPDQQTYPGYAYFQHSVLRDLSSENYPSAQAYDSIRTPMYQDFFEDILDGAAHYTYSTKTCSGTDEQKRLCKIYLTTMWHSATKISCNDEVHLDNGDPDYVTIQCWVKDAPLSDIESKDPFDLGESCSDCSSPHTNCRNQLCSARSAHANTGVMDTLAYCDFMDTEVENNDFCADYPGLYVKKCAYTCGDTNGYSCSDAVGASCSTTYCATDYVTQWECPYTCGLDHGCISANELSSTEKQQVDYLHNAYRALEQNVAEDQLKIYWSDDLEDAAKRIGAQCSLDQVSDRATYRLNVWGYDHLAEAVSGPHSSSTSIKDILYDSFVDGKDEYTYSTNTCSNSSTVGVCYSFTVRNSKNIKEFACVKSYCTSGSTDFHLICVYGDGNDYQRQGAATYTEKSVNLNQRPQLSCPTGYTNRGSMLCYKDVTGQDVLSDYQPTKNTACSNILDDTDCDTWASQGLCHHFPGYYPQNCASSCDYCSDSDPNRVKYCTINQGTSDNKNFNCNAIGSGLCSSEYYKWLCPELCDSSRCFND